MSKSVAVPNSQVEGYSAIYRSPLSPEKLVEVDGTLYDNFKKGVSVSGNDPCLGWRPLKGVAADGKTEEHGPYTWLTYSQVEKRMLNLGSGFRKLGANPGDKIGIYSVNRVEWVVTEQACNSQSLITVSLYDTLGPDAVQFIVNHAEISLAVVAKSKLSSLMTCAGNCPTLKHVVVMESISADEKAASKVPAGVTLHTMADVEAMGSLDPVAPAPPKPMDLATIMYTSGTTGEPKGVMLTHKAMLSDAESVILCGINLQKSDLHVSYLPLAHIFERVVQVALFGKGASIGFFRGDVLKLLDDIAELKPTIFVSVPRLFNRIYDRINKAVADKGGLAAKLFAWGMASKRSQMAQGKFPSHWLYDTLVFSKMKARLGGRVRLMLTGSAPISNAVKEFMICAFCAPLHEGYGLTESSAGACITLPGDVSLGNVGGPVACNELRLEDIPEMNYTAKDEVGPRGEICFRGPNIFSGYYKQEEKTREAIDADGWFHTGDIGRINRDGSLSIIDRKKNIFKLSQGEYVAAEYLEMVFAKARFVAQIFVYGDSLQACLVCVVVPDAEQMVAWAKENGKSEDMKVLCQDAAVNKMVLDELTKAGKAANLRGFEFVKAVHLFPELFSVENDLLTPSFKLRRPNATQRFRGEIDAMYAKLSASSSN